MRPGVRHGGVPLSILAAELFLSTGYGWWRVGRCSRTHMTVAWVMTCQPLSVTKSQCENGATISWHAGCKAAARVKSMSACSVSLIALSSILQW